MSTTDVCGCTLPLAVDGGEAYWDKFLVAESSIMLTCIRSPLAVMGGGIGVGNEEDIREGKADTLAEVEMVVRE